MSSEPQSSQPKLVQCPKCQSMVNERRLEYHLQKVHSSGKFIAHLAEKNRKAVEAAREVYVTTWIQCLSCQEKIQLKDIKRHFAVVHFAPASKEMLALIGLSEPINLFKSTREREAYWREFSGIQRVESEDLFEKTRVLNGGLFGLGKNRKH